MKTMKKLMGIALTLVMIVALAVPSFAAGEYTITINGTATGHTYEAYQIFKGELSEDGKKLSNLSWGTGVDGDALLAELAATTEFAGVASATAVADVLGTVGNDHATAQKFADIVSKHLATVFATSTEGSNNVYTIANLDAGYYIVKDEDGSVSGSDAYTRFILELIDSVVVQPKSDIPTVEKKVKEKNDSNGTTSDWQDAADYDIGDNVPFLLTGTLPENYADYETYSYVFTDTLSAGLTYNGDAKVYVDGTEITTGFVVAHNSGVLTITFADTKLVTSIAANSKITVEYTAKLNENAVVGSAGNPNTVNLEYSNNPNEGGSGDTGKTPDDKVVVFTYQLDVTKIDGNKLDEANLEDKLLAGAGFTLYKYNGTSYEEYKSEITGVTTFEFKGMDAGRYMLSETTTPDGYNTINDIYFTVEATYDTLADDPELRTLVVYQTDENGVKLEGANVTATFNVVLSSGKIGTEVINKSGAQLPSTGGIGTKIFYVVGTLIIAAAVVLLVVKKRRNEAASH